MPMKYINLMNQKLDDNGAAIDYMHWQVPLSKRFRALKLWFVLRSFGIEGIQKHVREGVRLAKTFEKMVRQDERFELPAHRVLGLVAFRLNGDNDLTEVLLKRLNKSGKLHMVPASLKGKYVIRFTVTSQYTTDTDIERDWTLIKECAIRVLNDESSEEEEIIKEVKVIPKKMDIRRLDRELSLKRKDYGMSLILSNVPMSPKFINGSFAAIFDNNESIVEFAKEITNSDFNGRPIRLSPRRRLKLRDQTKQQSLDSNFFSSKKEGYTKYQLNFKHGSLDSKVEELLESSSQDSEPGSNYLDELSENDAESDSSVQFNFTFDVPRQRSSSENGVKENGICLICKHCGHPVED